MEFSWSTFVLEIINFLVLLWILNRFLYRPVLNIIAQRRQQIESSLAQARQQKEQGEALQRQYENRLDDWEREKELARKALDREIEEERARRHEGLKRELEANRRKVEVVEARDRKQREQQLEVRALALAGRFAARLFTRIAGPEVERKLVEMAVADLSELPPDQLETLRHAWESEGDSIEVTSAGSLDELQRRSIEDGLGRLVNRPVACSYHEDAQLIGGLRVRLGPWMLHANLRDELESFVEAAQSGSTRE